MGKRRTPSRAAGRPTLRDQLLAALHPKESSAILDRLLEAHPELRPQAEGIANSLLGETSFERIATEVEDALSSIDDDDVYGRAGRHEGGYVEPGEAASELLEEAVEPFMCDLRRRLSLGKEDEALQIAQGILLGLYRVRGPACNAALEEATEFPAEMADAVRDAWTRSGRGKKSGRAAGEVRRIPIEFVEKFVPEWDWLVPKARSRGKANRPSPGKATRRRP